MAFGFGFWAFVFLAFGFWFVLVRHARPQGVGGYPRFLCFDKAKTMYFTMFSTFHNTKTTHSTRLFELLKAKTMYLSRFSCFDRPKTSVLA